MVHHTVQPNRLTPGSGITRPTGPRLPGEGGAMAFMDTLADLVVRYRSVHEAGRPPMETAEAVLEWAGSRLPDEVADRLVFAGAKAIGDPDSPSFQLSPGLAEAIDGATVAWLIDTWRSWPPQDQHELMARGLLWWERHMPSDEYELRYHSGDAYQARLLVMLGWIPSVVAAVVAGIAVAMVASNLWLLPVVALAGAVLGCLVTFVAWVAVGEVDQRWHLLGAHGWTAFFVTVLCTGPVVVLLVAVLALHLPPDLVHVEIDLDRLVDVVRPLHGILLLVAVAGLVMGRLRDR